MSRGQDRTGVGVDRRIGVGEVIKMKAEMACQVGKVRLGIWGR